MLLNRKRMAAFAIYALALAYLFSYLPMVYPMSCGCKFSYKAWFWETGPSLYGVSVREGAEPVRLAWYIDWQTLVPKVLIATIIALLAFVWIGDANSGWRDGITTVMNRFTLILLSLGFIAIVVALIGVILNLLDASQVGQGSQQVYVLFSRKPIYWIRMGRHYASYLFFLSLATSLIPLVVDFTRFKWQHLRLCIGGLVLTLCVYVYLMMLRNRFF
jgi:hypothetical protein